MKTLKTLRDIIENEFDNQIKNKPVMIFSEGGVLREYIITELVPQGGFKFVFKAYEKTRPIDGDEQTKPSTGGFSASRSDVVIKLMKEQSELSDLNSKRKYETIDQNIIGKLKHPNIAEIFFSGVYLNQKDVSDIFNGRTMLIEEFVQGKTLDQYLKEKGPLSLYEFYDLASQIVSGIKHAHNPDSAGKGYLHNDLLPFNLMYTPEGKIKIIDFGLNREVLDKRKTFGYRLSERFRKFRLEHSKKTKIKIRENIDSFEENVSKYNLPSPFVCSPDLIKFPESYKPSKNDDIYSLGLLFYRMLTGSFPFGDPDYLKNNRQEFFKKTVKEQVITRKPNYMLTSLGDLLRLKSRAHQYKSPRKIRKDIPQELSELIMDCLTYDSESQIADISSVSDRLKSIGEMYPNIFSTSENESFSIGSFLNKKLRKFNSKIANKIKKYSLVLLASGLIALGAAGYAAKQHSNYKTFVQRTVDLHETCPVDIVSPKDRSLFSKDFFHYLRENDSLILNFSKSQNKVLFSDYRSHCSEFTSLDRELDAISSKFDLKKMSKQSFSDFYEAHVKYNGIGFMGINRFTFKDKTEVDVFYELDTKKLEYSDTSFIEGFARAGGSEFTEKDLAEINQFKRIKSRDYRKLVQERKTFFPEWTPVSSLEELTKLILDYPFVFTRYFKSTQKVDEKSAELIAQALFNSHIYKNSLGNVIIKFDESYKPIGLRDYKLDRGIVMFLEAASLGEANKEYGGFDKEGLSLYLGGKHDYEYYLIKNLKHRIDIGVNNISYDSETNSYFVNIDMDYPNFQFHLTAFLKHEGNLISAFVNQPVIDEKVRYRDEDDVLRLSVTNVVERNLESVAQEIKYAAESYGLLPITVFSFLDYICPSLDDCYEPFFFKPLSEDLSPFGALDNNQLYIVNLCDFPHVKKLKDRSTKEFEDYVLPKPRNAIDTQSLPECQN